MGEQLKRQMAAHCRTKYGTFELEIGILAEPAIYGDPIRGVFLIQWHEI